jgi:two-component system, LytTR family, response regulator LytT
LEANGEPDLIISDIELLDGNAFKLYDMRPVRCPIIFSIAYQQFMVEAFKGIGLAYLLKPYNYYLFSEAMNKFRDWFMEKQPASLQMSLCFIFQYKLCIVHYPL